MTGLDFYAIAWLIAVLLIGCGLVYIGTGVHRIADAVTTRNSDYEEWGP